MSNKPCVFIQTNEKQLIGALVSAYSLKRNSRAPDSFDVRIMHAEEYPFLKQREGQIYLRDGVQRPWQNDDLQSFTPTRFMPPALMGYEGRALVIDPDVFAVGDAMELLSRDMDGKAILCRLQGGRKKYSTSVMLLDCAKLKHWQVEKQFNALFAQQIDYIDWTSLALESEDTVGLFEPEWNDFDRLGADTKLIHNTKRRTQPWKTGLPVDFFPVDRVKYFAPWVWLMAARRKLFGNYGLLGRYQPHPDPNQERFFFNLLKECLEQGIVSEALLKKHMQANYVRHDAFDVVRRLGSAGAKPLAA